MPVGGLYGSLWCGIRASVECLRPMAGLRTAAGTVSYRAFSAAHELALQTAEIARVYVSPPRNGLDWVARHRRWIFHLRCQISLTIAMALNRRTGLWHDNVPHLIPTGAGTNPQRTVTILSNSKPLDDPKMAAAEL